MAHGGGLEDRKIFRSAHKIKSTVCPKSTIDFWYQAMISCQQLLRLYKYAEQLQTA
jgi:hypothetical protein